MGLLAICSNFLDGGTGTTMRRCAIVLGSQQIDADSRSILKSYVPESESACVDCAVCVGNPLHSHTMTSTTKFPDSPQLLHRDVTIAIQIPVYLKLMIARLQTGQCIYKLKFDGVYLWFRSVVWPNGVMLQLLKGVFYRSGRSELPT